MCVTGPGLCLVGICDVADDVPNQRSSRESVLRRHKRRSIRTLSEQ